MPDGTFSFFPKTWILPADASELQKQSLDKKVNDLQYTLTNYCYRSGRTSTSPPKGVKGTAFF